MGDKGSVQDQPDFILKDAGAYLHTQDGLIFHHLRSWRLWLWGIKVFLGNSGDSLLHSSDHPHGGPVWLAVRGRKGAWLSFLAILMKLNMGEEVDFRPRSTSETSRS